MIKILAVFGANKIISKEFHAIFAVFWAQIAVLASFGVIFSPYWRKAKNGLWWNKGRRKGVDHFYEISMNFDKIFLKEKLQYVKKRINETHHKANSETLAMSLNPWSLETTLGTSNFPSLP